MANYWQVAKITLSKEEYRKIRDSIYAAGNDRVKLKSIWERDLITNPEVKKWYEQDKKTIVEAGQRITYLNRKNAKSFANWLEGSYNKHERTDVSDMYESYFFPHFPEPMQIGHAHKNQGYWGTGKNVNMENVAAEAFAEMFSAVTTGNASLGVIKAKFPKSYAIFEKMLEEMRK